MTDDVCAYLQEHGIEIGMAARDGSKTARNVIDWYVIWSKAPADNGAKTVLIEMVNLWRKECEAQS